MLIQGVQLIQNDKNQVELTYVKRSQLVFASPVTERKIFNSWIEATNYLTMWSILEYVQWWEDSAVSLSPLG